MNLIILNSMSFISGVSWPNIIRILVIEQYDSKFNRLRLIDYEIDNGIFGLPDELISSSSIGIVVLLQNLYGKFLCGVSLVKFFDILVDSIGSSIVPNLTISVWHGLDVEMF